MWNIEIFQIMYQSPRIDNEDDVTCSLIHSESESKENEKIQENEYFKVLQEVLLHWSVSYF